MSNGRQIGGVIGGVIGFVASGFNPKGFQWGYAIGSVVGGYVDPTKVYGPRLEDAATQTSTVGGVIPFGYGVFTCTGNIIWADELKEHKKSERAGKGGSQKNITYTYTRSYAIGVCEGQIFGYLWIKKNGKLVYASDPAGLGAAMGWTGKQISDLSAASAKFLQETTLYYGSDVQMPDSTIVAVVGVGNVSPFRDLAYIVKENEDLTDTAGAVSQYEFCIRATPPEAYLTSLPYSQFFQSEAMTGLAPTGGNLKKPLVESAMQADNAVVGLAPTGGELKMPPLQNFKDASTAALAPTGGTLKVPPVGQMQKDESTAGLAPTGGTLFVPDKSWNPSDKSAATILTNVNKTATANAASNTIKYARSIKSKNSGKWRVQFLLETFGASCSMGFATSAALGSWLGNNAAGWALWGNYSGSQVRAYTNNAYSTFTGVFTTGDVIDLLIDIDAGKAWWRINGVVVSGDPVAGTGAMLTFTAGTTLFVAADTYNGSSITLRALSADMTGSAVSGYTDGWDD